jgi:hypothetical protein
MPYDQLVATWVSFAIRYFRGAYRLTNAAFLALDGRYGIITFLVKNYELLHYYDFDYVVNDIMAYIVESGGDADAISAA